MSFCNYMPTEIECSKENNQAETDIAFTLLKKNLSKNQKKLFNKLVKLLPNLELYQHIAEISVRKNSLNHTITFKWKFEDISGTVKLEIREAKK